METFAKYSKRYLEGRQRITQRIEPCSCGCNGEDSWHARVMVRVVREIETFQEPYKGKAYAGYETTLCAVGRYKHPAGWRPCGLEANKLRDGSWIVGGWVTLQQIGDYGTPETKVEKGEYVPWAQRPETKAFLAGLEKDTESDPSES